MNDYDDDVDCYDPYMTKTNILNTYTTQGIKLLAINGLCSFSHWWIQPAKGKIAKGKEWKVK
jgi:hypothetical protein